MGFENERTKADGFVVLLDGMNGGVSPFLVKETGFSKGINITVRGGLVATRPGFEYVKRLGSAAFQGAGRWSLNAGDYIVYAVGGLVYVYDIGGDTIHSVAGTELSTTVNPLHFMQVDRWFVIQDGSSRPVVLDFDDAGVPVLYGRNPPLVCYVPGTVGQYAHLRLHYVPTIVPDLAPDASQADVLPLDTEEPGRMGFVSSDVRDSLNPEYVFRMSEHRVLAEGGHIVPPAEIGFIHGMSTFRNASAGTGVGPLLVFGREGVCAFDTSIARSQWKSVNIGQPLFIGAGTRSPYGIENVNNDVFYLDTDFGLRSIRYSTAAMAGGDSLSNVSLSNELTPFIAESSLDDLPKASLALADNRVLFTMCGTGEGYFRGLASLDLAQLQAMFSTDTPSYNGLWTGFKFLRVIAARYLGKVTHFAVVEESDGGFALLRLSSAAYTDPSGSQIECQLHTRYYVFGVPDLKQLKFCDLWLSDIRTDVNMAVYYRTSVYPTWTEIAARTVNAPAGGPQARRRLRFSLDTSSEICDPVTKEKAFNGHEFQFCIKWTGHCRIDRFQAQVDMMLDNLPDSCSADNEGNEVYPSSDGLDDFSYEVDV